MTEASLSLLAGAAWNGANLWCLRRLLGAWLGPKHSTRRVVVWLLVKYPLLYALAFCLLRQAQVSPVWFGCGFTLVLVAGLIAMALSVQRRLQAASQNPARQQVGG